MAVETTLKYYMNADVPNPYSPPASEALPPHVGEPQPLHLASRWIRLGSALIDGLANLAIYRLIGIVVSSSGVAPPWSDRSHQFHGVDLGVALMGMLVFYSVQWGFLSSSGQTIGKKLTRIRIVTMTGEKPSMTDLALKRYGFMNLSTFIPIAGGLIALADLFSIFRKDHRCLHDQVAGTQVIKILK